MRVFDFRARPNTKEYMTLFDFPGSIRTMRKLRQPTPPPVSLDEFMASVDEAGISRIVFTGRDLETQAKWKIGNDFIADAVKRYPGKITGFAGIDPLKGEGAVREIERAVMELGLKGISLDHARTGQGPNSRELYPLYEKCLEFDIPVAFTMGPGPGSGGPMRLNSPLLVDDLACDLPKLKIVCAHGGWPWVTEMIAVAFRHENVYFDNSAYHFMPGAQLIVDAANTIIPDKVLFATGFPFNPMKEVVDGFLRLPFNPDVLEQVMWGNAVRLLKLE